MEHQQHKFSPDIQQNLPKNKATLSKIEKWMLGRWRSFCPDEYRMKYHGSHSLPDNGTYVDASLLSFQLRFTQNQPGPLIYFQPKQCNMLKPKKI